MTRILAIDPGNIESAYVIIDSDDCRVIWADKLDNDALYMQLAEGSTHYYEMAAIEMVASYGMAVGHEVFDTCVWIGRFDTACRGGWPRHVFRREVKLHHCHDSRAKDSNIRQALVDRFAPGQPNHGKGTKAQPGWFHGFSADIWQAYALAVYVADKLEAGEQP
ncbi:hypothetical protein [Tessaracoccus massiliensis]|uniref:hypothetical protein n=1 Tax=Tessaracoccus massiliensis TaxID=1522311 RepID=UPI00058F37DF|nr:hypothetical protein [Tessaracoccus massiliensis]